jgi:hypothetical protein
VVVVGSSVEGTTVGLGDVFSEDMVDARVVVVEKGARGVCGYGVEKVTGREEDGDRSGVGRRRKRMRRSWAWWNWYVRETRARRRTRADMRLRYWGGCCGRGGIAKVLEWGEEWEKMDVDGFST